ncbi:aldose 1-epimerase [Meiothermus sp.]|uniref:aldose epimerase family protein n=1 Tax=Meiothermus sp. TaxID=1955249 RepID=UPI0021DC9E55|nr:aldose 1-epimerase [Meiothermus sp.]GIW35587.1 MAG: aldose 1-epimerase [Meiothermus sp.]
MNLQILQNPLLRLTVAPELGASVVGLELYEQGFWLPVLRPTSPAALVQRHSPDTSSYLLAPYSNRIRDGRFQFAGRTYTLRPNWIDGRQTIHGEVHGRAWKVQRFDEHILQCDFDARAFPDINFPFPFTAQMQYYLLDDGVEILTALQNVGTGPMPAGFGHHPYFMRHLGNSAEAQLSFEAERVYLTDATGIPNRPAEAIPPQLDFSQPRALGMAALDHVFVGWTGVLHLEWPGSGWQLELRADPIYSHLVVFTAPDGSVALEPATHATNGFNLLAQGWSDTGVQVLEPGGSISGRIRLTLSKGQ